ncbi:MAG TPA: hypothetical protein VH165_20825 [Kofleriaceae bacterium]|nr:hypothetical protein [Kofleriaceae bacterium]
MATPPASPSARGTGRERHGTNHQSYEETMHGCPVRSCSDTQAAQFGNPKRQVAILITWNRRLGPVHAKPFPGLQIVAAKRRPIARRIPGRRLGPARPPGVMGELVAECYNWVCPTAFWARLGQVVEATISAGALQRLKARSYDPELNARLAFATTAAGQAKAAKLIKARNAVRHGIAAGGRLVAVDRDGKPLRASKSR